MSEHKNLWAALLAFKTEAPALPKDKTNPHFKSRFTSLDMIAEKIDPLLIKHGLVWSTLPGHQDGHPTLDYRLAHAETGEALSGSMPLLLEKENSQGLGSALTYCRRYAKTAVLDLVCDEDDDGNGASRPAARAQPSQPKVPRLVSSATIEELRAAAKGLKFGDVKLAMTVCGIDATDVRPENAFARVPAEKAAELARVLAEADR